MNRPKFTDGITKYEKGFSCLRLNEHRARRKKSLHGEYFRKLKEKRSKRIENTKKVNSNLSKLRRLSK